MREKLKDSYSDTGRPSIDPELLLRILLIGYLYGITSERKLVEELRMHLAWRWFTGLGFDQEIPHHSTFSKNRHGRFPGVEAVTRQKQPLARRLRRAALVVVLLPFVLPLVLISVTLYLAHRVVLYMLVWVLWLPRGKDTLVVYSDSPIWHEYMTTQILPLVEERAIVLNWSERNRWPRLSFRAHVFHCFGEGREFNPLVVLFRPFRRAKIFRFWLPFKDWKRGYREPVERLRQELFSVL